MTDEEKEKLYCDFQNALVAGALTGKIDYYLAVLKLAYGADIQVVSIGDNPPPGGLSHTVEFIDEYPFEGNFTINSPQPPVAKTPSFFAGLPVSTSVDCPGCTDKVPGYVKEIKPEKPQSGFRKFADKYKFKKR